MIGHCCQNWGFYTLLNEMPTYMKTVLHFNIEEVRKDLIFCLVQFHRFFLLQNAFLSALPYLCMWVVANSGSYLADFLRSRGYLSTTNTRKLFNTIGKQIQIIN